MKKILIAAAVLSIILLSGCFGFLKKQAPQKPAAGKQQAPAAQQTPAAKNSQVQIPEPPSFQDGDYYLQALAARSLDTCEKIKNDRLAEKCKNDVNAALAQ